MKIYKKIILIIALIVLQISNVQISQAAFVIKKEIGTAQSAPSRSASVAKIKNTVSKSTAIKLVEGKKKDKTVAAVLALVLGSFGVHRFYMGQNKLGFYRLAIGALGLLLYLGGYIIAMGAVAGTGLELVVIVGFLAAVLGWLILFGSFIWNVVDFVRILTGEIEPDGGFETK
jgi:TM2 domain